MSAAIDAAVSSLRMANEELLAAKNERSQIDYTLANSNIRISTAQTNFDAARIYLADVAVAPE